MPKRTHQPKKAKRLKAHGLLKRSSSRDGQNIIKRRRAKGRQRLGA